MSAGAVRARLVGTGLVPGDLRRLTTAPRHPYTRALMLSAPVADVAEQRRRRESAAALGGKSAVTAADGG
ncbi:hypothetical protein [Streptomyces sp. DSM 41033]|uniref:hypothetical protein n=1 Tax=Streptomyces sp. DSM 41033 TaxID=3448655 RepID=UPI0040403794|nr:hypothetical protein OG491_29705 [Streptomyces sp. NBC_01175]